MPQVLTDLIFQETQSKMKGFSIHAKPQQIHQVRKVSGWSGTGTLHLNLLI